MNQAHEHAASSRAPRRGVPARPVTPSEAGSEPVSSLRDDDAQFARQVLRTEAQAIERVGITPEFHRAVDLILAATGTPAGTADGDKLKVTLRTFGQGSVVVSGLGKSGLIGQKISATLTSTGTPSHFLHPTEAMHGDLGKVRRGDVVVILSFGGNTDEVVSLAAVLRQDEVPAIAIVGKPDCDLARLATVSLSIGDVAEACPLNLAPTASTTAMLALGDALALTVSRRRSFGVDDFRKVHPGGALGKQLMSVVDAMRFRVDQNLPLVTRDSTVGQAIEADTTARSTRRAGAVLVVDTAGRLAGIFTDGDLRRLLIEHGHDALNIPVESVMTANPRRLVSTSLVRDAVQLVREFRIDEVPVVDEDGKPLGMIDVQDLIALKVIED